MGDIMSLLWAGLRKTFAVYWSIGAVAVGVGLYFSNRLDMPVVANNAASNGIAKVFLGVVALIVAVSTLPLFVTYGLTRRRFTRAAAVFATLVCLAYAAAQTVLAALDLTLRGSDEPAGKLVTLFSTNVTMFLAYTAAGWLVGLAYYRYGGGWGTLLLPLTLAPAAVADWAISYSFGGGLRSYAELGTRGAAMAVTVALAAALAGAAAGWMVGRDVPIRSR